MPYDSLFQKQPPLLKSSVANPRDNVSGVGIEFLGAASEHFEALEAYINHRTGVGEGSD